MSKLVLMVLALVVLVVAILLVLAAMTPDTIDMHRVGTGPPVAAESATAITRLSCRRSTAPASG